MAATLPLATLTADVPTQAGATVAVSASDDLQAAIDAAALGDTLVLEAGAAWEDITLPSKAGVGWVLVVSSALAALPAYGSRVSAADVADMASIEASSTGPALSCLDGAHHYRFIGIRFAPASGVLVNYELVSLGDPAETVLANTPSYIILDRCLVTGNATGDIRRGVGLHGRYLGVVGCCVEEIHEDGADSQAVCGWNGAGPFLVENNALEAAGEIVMFGGSDPVISGLIPSDITIRRNTLAKPSAWYPGAVDYDSSTWTVKNILELKNARRVLIEGNILERNWLSSQAGYAVLFTPRNQDGTASWSTVEDVTFRYNWVRDVAGGVNILGTDDLQTSGVASRLDIIGNLFTNVDSNLWGGAGRFLQVLDAPVEVFVEHNTVQNDGEPLVFASTRGAAPDFVFDNNIVGAGTYGIGGDGTYGNQAATLAAYLSNYSIAGNVLAGGTTDGLPMEEDAENYAPVNLAAVGFAADWSLAPTSPYLNAGSDETDPGIDLAALNAALYASTGGGGGGSVPAPPNETIATAAAMTVLPYSTTLDVSEATGPNYDVWWSYTAQDGDTVIGFWAFSEVGGTYDPVTTVWLGPTGAPTLYLGGLSAANKPLQIPVTSGTTYYFRVRQANSGVTPNIVLTLSALRGADTAAPVGSLLVNDDTTGFPAVIVSATTGEALQFINDFPAGEGGDTLATGEILVNDFATNTYQLWVKDPVTGILTYDSSPIVGTAEDVIRANRTLDAFYVTLTGANTPIQRVNADGSLGASWTLTGYPNVFGMAINNDETIAYFSTTSVSSPVHRWNMSTDTAMADFFAGTANYYVRDILALSDGTILFSSVQTVLGTITVYRYNEAGALQNTYGPYDSNIPSGTQPRIGYNNTDDSSFWLWTHGEGADEGLSVFRRIQVSDGTVLDTVTATEYEGGVYNRTETATPSSRFGVSYSCRRFRRTLRPRRVPTRRGRSRRCACAGRRIWRRGTAGCSTGGSSSSWKPASARCRGRASTRS
jgi:hypothetical protein